MLSEVSIKYITGVTSQMSSYIKKVIDSFTRNAGLNKKLNMIMNSKNACKHVK